MIFISVSQVKACVLLGYSVSCAEISPSKMKTIFNGFYLLKKYLVASLQRCLSGFYVVIWYRDPGSVYSIQMVTNLSCQFFRIRHYFLISADTDYIWYIVTCAINTPIDPCLEVRKGLNPNLSDIHTINSFSFPTLVTEDHKNAGLKVCD